MHKSTCDRLYNDYWIILSLRLNCGNETQFSSSLPSHPNLSCHPCLISLLIPSWLPFKMTLRRVKLRLCWPMFRTGAPVNQTTCLSAPKLKTFQTGRAFIRMPRAWICHSSSWPNQIQALLFDCESVSSQVVFIGVCRTTNVSLLDGFKAST